MKFLYYNPLVRRHHADCNDAAVQIVVWDLCHAQYVCCAGCSIIPSLMNLKMTWFSVEHAKNLNHLIKLYLTANDTQKSKAHYTEEDCTILETLPN